MASKNVKKVLRKIYQRSKSFHPTMAPVSWNKCVKYIKAKDKRTTYNATFKPLFAQVKQEMREEGTHESVLKRRAKAKTKELIKNKLALATVTAQQGSTVEEAIQPEGQGAN